jgi:hypothetical protein
MLYQMNQDEACKQHIQLALQLDPNLAKAKELLAEMELTRRSAAEE